MQNHCNLCKAPIRTDKTTWGFTVNQCPVCKWQETLSFRDGGIVRTTGPVDEAELQAAHEEIPFGGISFAPMIGES